MILPFHEFQSNLTDAGGEFNIIARLLEQLRSKHALTPIFGAEIEFYVSKEISLDTMSAKIGFATKREKGRNQFEIDIQPTSDLYEFIIAINNARSDISSKLAESNIQADFSSKPFAKDYGSAMHFHLNFVEDFPPERTANILCNYAIDTLEYFLPTKESHERLNHKFMAPTHICWGGNNRTCMIRIPDSLPKRVEHRLAGADINPIYPIYAMLANIVSGIESAYNLMEFSKIHGNAFDPQYHLTKIRY